VTGVVLLTGFVTGDAAGAGACEAVPLGGVVLGVELLGGAVWVAAWLLGGVPVAEGWLGVVLEWLDSVPEALPLVPEEPPLEPWAIVAEPEVAFETAEVTGDVTLLRVDLTPERTPDCPDWPGGGVSSVAACACRENSSIITKIPAATSASCTARRAMRRAIDCCITGPHRAGIPRI
jgi:hypothetical protein